MADGKGTQTLAQMSYEEAIRSIGQQRSQLDELRGRTGLLISAASITTAFLGATASTGRQGLPPEFFGALFPFGLAVGLCIYLLLPGKGWAFALRADTIEAYEGQPLDKVQWSLAHFLDKAIDKNERRIRVMSYIFVLAAIYMLLSVFAWIFLIE